MTVRRWFAGAAIAATLAACSGQETPEELIDRARESLAAGKSNAAVIDIKTALQQEVDNPEARLLFGRAYMMQNDPASAVDEFRRAASKGNAEAEALYARALVAAGRAADLVEFHEESGSTSADPVYLAALARAYSTRGNVDAADMALGQALEAGVENAYVLVTHALVELRGTREIETAAALLERATEEYPEDAEAWSVRADVARLEGDLESAADFYARAAELNPARLADRLGLVDVSLQLGRMTQAEGQLARLEKVIPDHPGVNFARGRMLVESGDYAAGLQELSRVLGSMPQHAGSLYLAGAANAREGNFATAQSQLTRFLEVQPGHLPARLELANVYLQMQEPAAAEDVARRVLDADPENVVAMRLLASALGAQGLFAESAQVYADLAEIQPDAVDARVGLGTTRLLSGDSAGGLAELRAALEQDPD
ncbi:MAG: tetratricopeptide repeat protein, partial [Chromatocurvus sp.]